MDVLSVFFVAAATAIVVMLFNFWTSHKLENQLADTLAAHGITIDSIHAKVTVLEDKAKNALTGLEKTVAIQEAENALAKLQSMLEGAKASESPAPVIAAPSPGWVVPGPAAA